MDSGIQIKPTKDSSPALSADRRRDQSYTLAINGATVNIRFAGTDSLNHRLAGVFSAMLG